MVEIKLTYNEWIELWKRISTFKASNGRWPNYADIKGIRVSQSDFLDAYHRVVTFKNQYNRNPETVRIVGTPIPVVTTDGVYVESSWLDEDQNTNYTCGPTSSKMALSTLGVITTEEEMAVEEGTTERGTSHQGIIRGCIEEAREKNIVLTIVEMTFNQIGGWKGLGETIQNPKQAVIAHGRCAGWPTYYKSYTGGHYVFPVKVDLNQSKIWIADPARTNTLVYSFNEFKAGLDLISQPSFIVLKRV